MSSTQPGQDERDWEFAELHSLPIIRTIEPPEGWEGEAYLGDGAAINSESSELRLDGLRRDEAKTRVIDWLDARFPLKGLRVWRITATKAPVQPSCRSSANGLLVAT